MWTQVPFTNMKRFNYISLTVFKNKEIFLTFNHIIIFLLYIYCFKFVYIYAIISLITYKVVLFRINISNIIVYKKMFLIFKINKFLLIQNSLLCRISAMVELFLRFTLPNILWKWACEEKKQPVMQLQFSQMQREKSSTMYWPDKATLKTR